MPQHSTAQRNTDIAQRITATAQYLIIVFGFTGRYQAACCNLGSALVCTLLGRAIHPFQVDGLMVCYPCSCLHTKAHSVSMVFNAGYRCRLHGQVLSADFLIRLSEETLSAHSLIRLSEQSLSVDFRTRLSEQALKGNSLRRFSQQILSQDSLRSFSKTFLSHQESSTRCRCFQACYA